MHPVSSVPSHPHKEELRHWSLVQSVNSTEKCWKCLIFNTVTVENDFLGVEKRVPTVNNCWKCWKYCWLVLKTCSSVLKMSHTFITLSVESVESTVDRCWKRVLEVLKMSHTFITLSVESVESAVEECWKRLLKCWNCWKSVETVHVETTVEKETFSTLFRWIHRLDQAPAFVLCMITLILLHK